MDGGTPLVICLALIFPKEIYNCQDQTDFLIDYLNIVALHLPFCKNIKEASTAAIFSNR